jgi:hypothetical protein
MANDEPIIQTFAVPTPQVWDALRATIASLSYKDVQEDAEARSIDFRTGMSLWSWQGQNMTATVRDIGAGQTEVAVTGNLALKVQVTSWGEKKRIAKKVLAGVQQHLATPVSN